MSMLIIHAVMTDKSSRSVTNRRQNGPTLISNLCGGRRSCFTLACCIASLHETNWTCVLTHRRIRFKYFLEAFHRTQPGRLCRSCSCYLPPNGARKPFCFLAGKQRDVETSSLFNSLLCGGGGCCCLCSAVLLGLFAPVPCIQMPGRTTNVSISGGGVKKKTKQTKKWLWFCQLTSDLRCAAFGADVGVFFVAFDTRRHAGVARARTLCLYTSRALLFLAHAHI